MECQKNKQFPPKLMLTQQTFDTHIFQFPSMFPTEYLVDKLDNQYIDISWCTNTFGKAVYLGQLISPKSCSLSQKLIEIC